MNKTFSSTQLNKTGALFKRKNQMNSQKMRIIKKIILISSMNKQTMKIFLKMIECPPRNFNGQHKVKLMKYSQTILDKDKQKQLQNTLEKLYEASTHQQCCQLFLKLIKFFILSPIEKSYILKIENQLKEDEELDEEIRKVQQKIDEQKQKKLQVYYEQKKGKLKSNKQSCELSKTQILNQQNKLQRANQKLNEICANNNKLRQKINQLRKEKNVMEEIYNKLKKQLQEKKQNVEATIKSAGQAYCARNQAEADLKSLKENAEQQKQQFKIQCQKLNKQIQYDLRFKQFIKSKQKQKQTLSKLEEQIRLNQKSIQLKKQSNLKIDLQYRESVTKQLEIKKCFERIKKQIGISEIGIENSGKQLLNIFIGLYEKNTIMTNFVNELNKEVEELQNKIQLKKEQIQKACFKSSPNQLDSQKIKSQMKNKLELQERKKSILKNQYQKSVETINIIKQYLQQVFQQIDVDKETIQKLKNSSITQENLVEFLGQLEKRGLQAITKYSKLIGQQIKAQNGTTPEIQQQLNDLNNIVTYDNVNNMNGTNCFNNKFVQYPSQLLIKIRQQDQPDEKNDHKKSSGILQREQFKRFALQSLQNFSKKSNVQIHKEKGNFKKFTISNSKSKIKK